MKKVLILTLCIALVLAAAGCGSRGSAFLPEPEDFLSANTVTGLLNRYEMIACFERLMNTADRTDTTRSWQYYQKAEGGVAQVSDGAETTLFYNRLLLKTADDGRNVTYGVYLNESDQPEKLYFQRQNLFGEDYGAEITYLDEEGGNLRFQSRFTIDAQSLEAYSLWDAEMGDEIVGTYTIAKDDLRILKSEVSKTHDGETELIAAASWAYSRPMQLHEMWEAYAGDETRRLITVKYADETEKRYFIPQGVTPELYTDPGHRLFWDENYETPYAPEPVTADITLYYK